MQHHTAQHLLSQVFIQLFELETLSANINGYTPSTIDLPTAGLAPEQLVEAEGLANQLIFEDHPVRAAFVTPDELALLPLRKAPKVSGNIRIVEIEGLDFSSCGGTHCQSTGQIGVLKILKTEKVNERTRVHFAAGWQALEVFRQAYQAVSSLAGEMSIHPQDLQAAVERQGEQLRQVQKELGELRQERLAWEAQRLLQDAETIGGRQVVLAVFDLRPAQELRWLADSLRRQPRAAAVLASHDGEKLLLAAACGAESGLSARELLSELLTPLNGRGGGDSSLAQGGGSASVERVQELMDQARELLGRS
jgi:alanyl-tRNA synthetase